MDACNTSDARGAVRYYQRSEQAVQSFVEGLSGQKAGSIQWGCGPIPSPY